MLELEGSGLAACLVHGGHIELSSGDAWGKDGCGCACRRINRCRHCIARQRWCYHRIRHRRVPLCSRFLFLLCEASGFREVQPFFGCDGAQGYFLSIVELREFCDSTINSLLFLLFLLACSSMALLHSLINCLKHWIGFSIFVIIWGFRKETPAISWEWIKVWIS